MIYLPLIACCFGILGSALVLIAGNLMPERFHRAICYAVVFGTMAPLALCCIGACFTGNAWFGATFGTVYFALVIINGLLADDPNNQGICATSCILWCLLPFVFLLHPSVVL